MFYCRSRVFLFSVLRQIPGTPALRLVKYLMGPVGSKQNTAGAEAENSGKTYAVYVEIEEFSALSYLPIPLISGIIMEKFCWIMHPFCQGH
jgi:hypothetical protein